MSGTTCAVAGAGLGPINPIPVNFLYDYNVSGSATAGVQFETNGTLTKIGSGGDVGAGWFPAIVTGIGSVYWVRLTVTAGAAPTVGTTGTWQQITTARGWSWVQSGSGIKTATATLELAVDAAGANVIASKAGISVTAEVD